MDTRLLVSCVKRINEMPANEGRHAPPDTDSTQTIWHEITQSNNFNSWPVFRSDCKLKALSLGLNHTFREQISIVQFWELH